jgi:hypothetical protein
MSFSRISILLTLAVCLTTGLQAVAAVLSYKIGPSSDDINIHSVIYTDKIGYTPIIGGSIAIDGRTITVFARPDEISERFMLLGGQLIKARISQHGNSMQLKAIAYFNSGKLLQDQSKTRQHDIVFIDGGFISGKIESFTISSLQINDHGQLRSVKLSDVLAIRSPYAYNLQMDLLADDTYSNTDTEYRYNVANCSLRNTIPAQAISSQSIAHPAGTGDDDLDDDLIDEPLRGLGREL